MPFARRADLSERYLADEAMKFLIYSKPDERRSLQA